MNNYLTQEEVREQWNEAFLPEVPSLIKSAEIKNSDGSYSCITCRIKKDAIADYWLDLRLADKQALIEEFVGMIEAHKSKGIYSDYANG